MNRIFRALATTSIAALTATMLVACGGTSNASGDGLLAQIEAGNVTLGTKYDQPGLGLREADGSMTGLDVEIMTYVVNSIADANGWEHPEITWRETPSAQRETLIQNGEVAAIGATYSINSSRAEAVSFGGPYLLTHQGLLVRSEGNDNEHYGIGVTKDDTETVDAINTALEAMYEDGSFDTFVNENLEGGVGVEQDKPGDLSFLEQ